MRTRTQINTNRNPLRDTRIYYLVVVLVNLNLGVTLDRRVAKVQRIASTDVINTANIIGVIDPKSNVITLQRAPTYQHRKKRDEGKGEDVHSGDPQS